MRVYTSYANISNFLRPSLPPSLSPISPLPPPFPHPSHLPPHPIPYHPLPLPSHPIPSPPSPPSPPPPKVDRCYGWRTMPDSPIRDALAAQDDNCKSEFKDRCAQAILALNEQGLNAKLYWENDDPQHTVSLVPTSAISGEGVPDLIMMVIRLTQELQQEKLMYMNVLQCTVLEVKVVEGLGHTVDVVLVNGTIREGDTIVVSTMEGPVVTQIRALLTPPPNREMRIKSEYIHHQVLTGAIGIKIVAPDIARAIAGTPVLVVEEGDDLEDVKEDVQSDLSQVMKALETDVKGVMVHASTLGECCFL